jgi:hypothetical protein
MTTPQDAFDRKQARDWFLDHRATLLDDRTLDVLAGCVRPVAVDRDVLIEAFRFMPEEYRAPAADWVLALVRPVAGVTQERYDEAVRIIDELQQDLDAERRRKVVYVGPGLPSAGVEGIILTPKEAAQLARVLAALRRPGGVSIADLPVPEDLERLADKLEAARTR